MSQGTNPELREPESVRIALKGDLIFIFQGCSLYKHSSEEKAASDPAPTPCITPETHGELSPNKTFLHKSFCEGVFNFPLGKILRPELLSHKIDVCLTIRNLSQSDCTILYTHQQCMRIPVISIPPVLVLSVF